MSVMRDITPELALPTRWLCILWPAFMMAGVLETVVFAGVDPQQVEWFGHSTADWQPTGIYTVAFFVFWGVIALASSITHYLTHPHVE